MCKDGRSVVEQAIKELESLGYLQRRRMVDEKGQFAGYTYDIYEEPNLELVKPCAENPSTEKPSTEKPLTENPSTEKPSAGKPLTEKGEQLNTNNKILNKQILTHSTHADTGAPARKKRTYQGEREYHSFEMDKFYADAIARSERILEEFAKEQAEKEKGD